MKWLKQWMIWGGALFSVVIGYIGLTTTQIETELSLLFPKGQTPKQEFLLEALREGPSSRLILIGLEGAHIDILTEVSKELSARMRKLGDFVFVHNGDPIKTTHRLDLLFEYRYLLSPDINETQFSPQALQEALHNRIRELTTPISSLVKAKLPHDPTNEYWTILQSWMNNPTPSVHNGVWMAPHGTRALLMAQTKTAAFNLEDQRGIQKRIHQVFKSTISKKPEYLSVRLLLTGPPVFAVETEQTVKNESSWLSITAVVLVAAFLYANFHSLTPIVLSLFPLICGFAAGVLGVNLAFGFIHGITLAFGATLIGVAVDYPIHLFSHADGADGLENSLKSIWPTLFLGAGTTALGYCALWFSGFPGLSQLGLFALIGILVSALVTRWALPCLASQSLTFEHSLELPIRLVRLLQRNRTIFPILIFIPAVYLGLSPEMLWETDIANLTPIPKEKKELDRTLRAEIGAPSVRDLIVIEGTTEQEVLGKSQDISNSLEVLVKQGAMGGFEIATHYLPSHEIQLSRRSRLPDPHTLKTNLDEALLGIPFKSNLFKPFLDDVAHARMQDPLSSGDFIGTPFGIKIRSLVFKQNEKWISLIPLRQVEDRKPLRRWDEALENPQVWYLDLKEESNKIVSAYHREILVLVGWGSLVICVVLFIRIRTFWLLTSVLLPIASSLLVVIALLHALDERLSLFHLASLLLVVGLGLDYALFFNRRVSAPTDRDRTISSIWICCMTTILVFGILAYSEIPVLRAIGLTTLLGALTCFMLSAMLSRHEPRF